MHQFFKLSALSLAMLGLCAPASAATSLIAVGSLNGVADMSGLNYALENGVAADLFGGLGSALTYVGNNQFLALPDRGPNADVYNSGVDNTTSYIPRFHTVSLSLSQSAAGAALPYQLSASLQRTTLLSSSTPLVYGSGAAFGLGNGAPQGNTAGKFYFSGRSDNFDASQGTGNAANGRLDPEGIRVSNDGRSVFVSDEYGPYVYQFDRMTGERIRTFNLPANLAAPVAGAVGSIEDAAGQGRVANRGMEGLAITPDGKTLVGIMQSPLLQDGGKDKTTTRIVSIDIATGATKQFAYKLDDKKNSISEIVAINDHQFLVDERDGKGLGDGSSAGFKKIFKIDLNNASDVSDLSGSDNIKSLAVGKSLFVDVKAALNTIGIGSADVPAKLEGMSFGEDVLIDGALKRTLYISNDNDFSSAVPNSFYVFAIDAADLPNYQAQNIAAVPEPESYAMMLAGLGLVAFVARRRQHKA